MHEGDSTITVTRNGEAVGIMMTPDRYEALLETIEILDDKLDITGMFTNYLLNGCYD